MQLQTVTSSRYTVSVVTNGVFPSNCYLVETGEPGHCLVVDPGLDPSPIEAALQQKGLRPQAVLCTHGHFDHAGSAAHFSRQYGCPVHLHARDLKTLKSSNFLLMAFKIPARMQIPEVAAVEGERSELLIGPATVVFHAVPGHTPGSCLIECGDLLFTGDTMYARGVGLSRLPGEDAEQLRHSLKGIWQRFPDGTRVCPGHGESADFGSIKRQNTPLLRFLNPDDASES